MCIGNQSCLIYIYVCVHSPYIFFDSTYALVINLYGWFFIHMYNVFFCFACPELMLVHCQLTPRMSTQCALHYTCTLCHMTDLYLLNCIYIISTT